MSYETYINVDITIFSQSLPLTQDKGKVVVKLGPGVHIPTDKYVEVTGKVNSDSSIFVVSVYVGVT